MTRPITFPKTSDGHWTNSETGIRIERYGKGYRPFRPAWDDEERRIVWIGIAVEQRTLEDARYYAKRYARDFYRYTIAEAFDEAWAMWDRVEIYRHCPQHDVADCEWCSPATYVDTYFPDAHAEALREDAERAEALALIGQCAAGAVATGAALYAFKIGDYSGAGIIAREQIDRQRGEEQFRQFIERIRDYRNAHHCGLIDGRAAVMAEDRAEALREDAERTRRRQNAQILARLDSINRNALCMRTSDPRHASHMQAVWPECRETVDLYPIEGPTTPAEMRAAGLIGPYLWADENRYENAR